MKSQAVDWSSFSALEALRAEEEDGNLGDFSVFGDSNLKPISTEVSTTPADRLSVGSLSYYQWPFIALQSLTWINLCPALSINLACTRAALLSLLFIRIGHVSIEVISLLIGNSKCCLYNGKAA